MHEHVMREAILDSQGTVVDPRVPAVARRRVDVVRRETIRFQPAGRRPSTPFDRTLELVVHKM
jgi:hypothetical protein